MTAVTEQEREPVIIDLRDGRSYTQGAVDAYREARRNMELGDTVEELIAFMDEWEATH